MISATIFWAPNDSTTDRTPAEARSDAVGAPSRLAQTNTVAMPTPYLRKLSPIRTKVSCRDISSDATAVPSLDTVVSTKAATAM